MTRRCSGSEPSFRLTPLPKNDTLVPTLDFLTVHTVPAQRIKPAFIDLKWPKSPREIWGTF